MKRPGRGIAMQSVTARRIALLGATALTLAAIAGTAPARAADLPAPTPGYYPPVMPPALYDWTGFYFGGHVGADLLSDTFSQSAPGTFGFAGNANLGPVGLVGGAHAGVNVEFHPWVIGAEVSWSGTTLTGNGSVLTTTPGATERETSAPFWFASATGRAGYAANDLLIYAKAGFGEARVSYTEDILIGGATNFTQNLNATRSGFTGGIGVEYGLTEHFSARLEYDLYYFGTKDLNFTALTPVSIRSNLNVLTFGIDYRFDWAGGGPVAAKY